MVIKRNYSLQVSGHYHPNIETYGPLCNRMHAQWKVLCSRHQEGAQTGLGILCNAPQYNLSSVILLSWKIVSPFSLGFY